MKRYIITGAIFMLMASFIYRHTAVDKVFKQLHTLEGKWIMKTKRGFVGEEWVKLTDDHLQNKGFFIKGIDTVVTERVALTKTMEGIFYTSTVEDQNNKQPVSFKLISADKAVFIFENPSHDFPKRIIYEFVTADSIHAYIDGGVDALEKRQDFYYRKVK